MIIANPIYDVVFKRLMEDKRIAKFFVETLTGETVLELELKPQEFTFYKELKLAENQSEIDEIKERMYGLLGLAVYRVDFLATIKTADNEYKKVLIEIQKAKNPIDLMRFRNYLAEQYKKEDEVMVDSVKTKAVLPIITIYLLGFKLNEISSCAIKVNRQYVDLITQLVIDQKSDFVEKLTHDCFIVQIPRIQSKLQTKLEMLLSVFEQTNFTDDKEITKDYRYAITDDILKSIVDILHHAGTDPMERSEIEKEQEALRVFENGMSELRLTIAQKDKELSDKEKELLNKEKEMAEMSRIIADLQQKLNQK